MATVRGHGPTRGYRAGAMDGALVYWISLNYKQSNKVWRDLKKSTKHVATKISETDREIELPGGGMVCVRSADNPDSLRGEGLDGVVLDEGAFMPPDIWFKVMRPALSDRKGWAIFPTTPNGYNWFRDLCTTANTLDSWKEWHCPTSSNPVIDAAELAEAKLNLSTREYDQEYEALFVEQEGAEWPSTYLDDTIWFRGDPPQDKVCRVIAADPSKGKSEKSDYTALVDVIKDTRGDYWVDATIERMDCSKIVDRSIALCRERRPDAIGFESVAFQELLADLFVERANQAGVEVAYYKIDHGSVGKNVRIRRLTPLLSRRKLHVRDNIGGRLLVDQLRQFPIGDHDDGPDGLEMAVRLAGEMSA